VSRARWVILTPSETEPEWRRRVTDAVAAAGLTPVPWSAELGPEIFNDPKAVVLAQEMSQVRAHGQVPDAVILTDPESSVRQLGQTVLPLFPQALWTASQIHAEACTVPDSTPVIGGGGLMEADKVALWPGMTVAAPGLPSRPKGERAAAVAMSLYRQGRPAVGARTDIAPKLFLYDARNPVKPPRYELDLTGRPRILMYGPYVSLPPGVWTFHLQVQADAAAVGRRFRVEWGTQSATEPFAVKLDRVGLYEIAIDFSFMEPSACEARVILEEAAFEGAIRIMATAVSLRRSL